MQVVCKKKRAVGVNPNGKDSRVLISDVSSVIAHILLPDKPNKQACGPCGKEGKGKPYF
mgnify:CR=1 FL=1